MSLSPGLFFPFISVGLKKIRNPERTVRIAVGYTGHTPPKSDDADANSKMHTNTLCFVYMHAGSVYLWVRVF